MYIYWSTLKVRTALLDMFRKKHGYNKMLHICGKSRFCVKVWRTFVTASTTLVLSLAGQFIYHIAKTNPNSRRPAWFFSFTLWVEVDVISFCYWLLFKCENLPLCIVLDSASATLDFLWSSGEPEMSMCSCLILGLISSSGELEGIGDVDALLLGVEISLSAPVKKTIPFKFQRT